jgi:hypothetical protein
MKRLGWLSCLGFLAGVGAAPGCGEPFVTSTGTGGSSSSSTSGTGGVTNSTGTGGAACVVGMPSTCPAAGDYCAPNGGSATCVSCSDTSRFAFGKAVNLPVTPLTNAAIYPRIAPNSGDLYFTQEDKGPPVHFGIVSAVLPPQAKMWNAWAPEPAPINGAANSSGPLYIADSSGLSNIVQTALVQTGNDKPVLLWDSDRDTGKREIFAVNPGVGTQASLVKLNTTGLHDSRVAVASGKSPLRLWWMSDTGAVMPDRLVTAPADNSTPMPVPMALESGCHAASVDNPWVTADGTLLLFDAVRPDLANCGLAATMVHHLFYSPVGADGQQPSGAKAKALLPGDPLTYDVTPSLTPDMCYLLFSRVDATGNVTLSIAARE